MRCVFRRGEEKVIGPSHCCSGGKKNKKQKKQRLFLNPKQPSCSPAAPRLSPHIHSVSQQRYAHTSKHAAALHVQKPEMMNHRSLPFSESPLQNLLFRTPDRSRRAPTGRESDKSTVLLHLQPFTKKYNHFILILTVLARNQMLVGVTFFSLK